MAQSPGRGLAPCLMIQGTSSHVGKSLLCTALCRLFRQEGLRVAPFKSQNMSLNSYVTPDGGELARSQALQAEAAGAEPAVEMNPILLKPTNDMTSQVVLLGRPAGTLPARAYREEFRPRAWQAVTEALARLRRSYDLVIIEGAGSPAEVNLRPGEMVNMSVAELADAPVFLVGDIERGGVFASLLGTLWLLTPAERRRVAGLVVNKFRGDPSLFEPGVSYLEARSGKPVAGVLPWIQVDLEEEDSLGLTRYPGAAAVVPRSAALLDVAVLAYPQTSNFSDLDALARVPGLGLRLVRRGAELGDPDAVILPGSKNVLADLAFLRQEGLDVALRRAVEAGAAVVGLCGGYQMLGRRLSDPTAVDGTGGEGEGLGLLSVETVYLPEKRTARVRGHLAGGPGPFAGLAGLPVEGYEIHHGASRLGEGAEPLLWLGEPAVAEGCVAGAGRIMGTYLHGFFDNEKLCLAWVNWLRERKGLSPLAGLPDDARRRARELDRLADWARANLRLELLFRAAGLTAGLPGGQEAGR